MREQEHAKFFIQALEKNNLSPGEIVAFHHPVNNAHRFLSTFVPFRPISFSVIDRHYEKQNDTDFYIFLEVHLAPFAGRTLRQKIIQGFEKRLTTMKEKFPQMTLSEDPLWTLWNACESHINSQKILTPEIKFALYFISIILGPIAAIFIESIPEQNPTLWRDLLFFEKKMANKVLFLGQPISAPLLALCDKKIENMALVIEIKRIVLIEDHLRHKGLKKDTASAPHLRISIPAHLSLKKSV